LDFIINFNNGEYLDINDNKQILLLNFLNFTSVNTTSLSASSNALDIMFYD